MAQVGKRGRQAKRLKEFAEKVHKAMATARLKVEMSVLSEDPKTWLTRGPGKETQASKGWTTPTKPIVLSDNRHIHVIGSRQGSEMLSIIFKVLANFPEAREALIAELNATHPVGCPKVVPAKEVKAVANEK